MASVADISHWDSSGVPVTHCLIFFRNPRTLGLSGRMQSHSAVATVRLVAMVC